MKFFFITAIILILFAVIYNHQVSSTPAPVMAPFVITPQLKQSLLDIANERFDYYYEGIREGKPHERGFTKAQFASSTIAVFSNNVKDLADLAKFPGKPFRIVIIKDDPSPAILNEFSFVTTFFNAKVKQNIKESEQIFVKMVAE